VWWDSNITNFTWSVKTAYRQPIKAETDGKLIMNGSNAPHIINGLQPSYGSKDDTHSKTNTNTLNMEIYFFDVQVTMHHDKFLK